MGLTGRRSTLAYSVWEFVGWATVCIMEVRRRKGAERKLAAENRLAA
jgi:hypothetical protein